MDRQELQLSKFREIIRVLKQEIKSEYGTNWRKFDEQGFRIINNYFIKRYWCDSLSLIYVNHDKIFDIFINIMRSNIQSMIKTSTCHTINFWPLIAPQMHFVKYSETVVVVQRVSPDRLD